MFGRNILAIAIAGALLLPRFADCLNSATADAQTMACCAQLNCAPGHQKLACFSNTPPAEGSQSAPVVRITLATPSVAADFNPPAEALIVVAFGSTGVAAAPQHSPPDLYTLHLALLI
jgi:hypothetical protein